MTRDPDLLAVKVDVSGSSAVCHAVGALDVGTVATFRDAVEPLVQADRELVIDMSEVTFCDSTGLGAIVGLYRLASESGGSLILRSPTRRVAAVLAMTGVDQVVTVLDAPESAASG
jgi:anti-sigma B factor antagonist